MSCWSGETESAPIKRLDQVVNGGNLERLDRILVMGRDEHDFRHALAFRRALATDSAQQLEAVDGWHMNVEKENVGALSPDRF